MDVCVAALGEAARHHGFILRPATGGQGSDSCGTPLGADAASARQDASVAPPPGGHQGIFASGTGGGGGGRAGAGATTSAQLLGSGFSTASCDNDNDLAGGRGWRGKGGGGQGEVSGGVRLADCLQPVLPLIAFPCAYNYDGMFFILVRATKD